MGKTDFYEKEISCHEDELFLKWNTLLLRIN